VGRVAAGEDIGNIDDDAEGLLMGWHCHPGEGPLTPSRVAGKIGMGRAIEPTILEDSDHRSKRYIPIGGLITGAWGGPVKSADTRLDVQSPRQMLRVSGLRP
jgi:hypothetical protein